MRQSGGIQAEIVVLKPPYWDPCVTLGPGDWDRDVTFIGLLTGPSLPCRGWYDNEWGYVNRCVDLLVKMAG